MDLIGPREEDSRWMKNDNNSPPYQRKDDRSRSLVQWMVVPVPQSVWVWARPQQHLCFLWPKS